MFRVGRTDYSDELGLIGPFRDQGLDRPNRLKALEGIFKSGAPSFEERIEAINEATNLTKGADVKHSIEALMELVMNPEAGSARSLCMASQSFDSFFEEKSSRQAFRRRPLAVS